jgi:hypothetical protein
MRCEGVVATQPKSKSLFGVLRAEEVGVVPPRNLTAVYPEKSRTSANFAIPMH